MAESIRQIPAKYGTAERVLHPRIGSMGRRLLACLPAVVLGLLCLAVLGVRRPAPMGIIVLVIVIIGCAVSAWRWLRPVTVAITPTHVLGSRTIGFHTMERAKIERLVVVDSLRRSARTGSDGTKRRRGVARPYLWAADDAGRRLFRMDGTIWDRKSIDRLVEHLGVKTERFAQASPAHMAKTWPRLVGPFMRFPWLRPLLTGLAAIAAVLLLVWMAWNQG